MRPVNELQTMTICATVVVAALAYPAFAQEQASAAKPDLRAHQLITRVSEFYGGLDTVVVEATLKMEERGKEEPRELSNTFDVAMEDHKLFSVKAEGDLTDINAVCDGEKLYIYSPSENKYMEHDAPAEPARVLGASTKGLQAVGTMIMAELFREEPFKELIRNIEQERYLGKEDLNGKQYHHARYTHEEIDWDMWIADGKDPLVRKITVDLRKIIEGFEKELDEETTLEFGMEILYDGWVINGNISDDRFVFTPPEGAEKIEQPAKREKPERGKLEGGPAPLFELELLEGGTLDLSAHKGKHVVILDFWATWCGPCRKALPVYAKVAGEYKDKGVRFYAVNLREKPDVVRAFLKKLGVDCSVALDKDGAVADKYNIYSIPTSVVINRKGVVESIHIGLMPNLESALKEELDELVGE